MLREFNGHLLCSSGECASLSLLIGDHGLFPSPALLVSSCILDISILTVTYFVLSFIMHKNMQKSSRLKA